MNNAVEFLKGKKTYGVALIGGLYLLGCFVGWFQFDEKVCAALGIGFVATFRSALNGIFPKPEAVQGNVLSTPGSNGTNATNKTDGTNVIPLRVIIGLVGTLALPMIFSGCAALDKAAAAVSSPRSHMVTNVVTQVVTNLVPVAVPVPGATVVQTNFVDRVTTNTIERVTTVTNWVEKESIATGLQTAKTGAAITTAVAPQFGGPATAGLGLASAVLAGLVAWKNKREKEAALSVANASAQNTQIANDNAMALQGINDDLTAQLHAVVTGVEQVTTAIDANTGEKVKAIIARVSKDQGVSDALHATVKAITQS